MHQRCGTRCWASQWIGKIAELAVRMAHDLVAFEAWKGRAVEGIPGSSSMGLSDCEDSSMVIVVDRCR
jgi:hypothetical protein